MELKQYDRVFSIDFSRKEHAGSFSYVPGYKGCFRICSDEEKNGDPALEIVSIGPQLGEPRRPRTYALAKGLLWEKAHITLEFRYTFSEGTPDVVVPFAYKDARHWYYVHLSTETDNFHTVIMKVDGEERITINTEPSEAPIKHTGYHKAQIILDALKGTVAVYMGDEMTTPLMVGNDAAMQPGLVGLGSFDTCAFFSYLVIKGRLAHTP